MVDARVRQGEKCCGSMAPLKTQFEARIVHVYSPPKSPLFGAFFLPSIFLPSASVSLSRFFLRSRSQVVPSLSQGSSGRGFPSFVGVGTPDGLVLLLLLESRSSFQKSILASLRLLPPVLCHHVGFSPVSGILSGLPPSDFRIAPSPFCFHPPRQAFSWFSGFLWAVAGRLEVSLCSNTSSSRAIG